MDWMNRGVRPSQSSNQSPAHASGAPTPTKQKRLRDQRWLRVGFVTLLFSATLLIVALVLYTALGGRNSSEGKYVDTSKVQAVFLNGGQVYFGNVKSLNDRYMRLDNVFYLRVNQQVQPNSSNAQQSSTPELVPLGCELHRPQKEMIINRSQITFWENLKDESAETTVPGAIKKYMKDNPNGQTCSTQTTNTPTDATKKP